MIEASARARRQAARAVDDGHIRSRQRDAHAASARGQQVGEAAALRVVEAVDASLPPRGARVTVQPLRVPAGVEADVLQQVQHQLELAVGGAGVRSSEEREKQSGAPEDQNLVAVSLELGQQLGEQHHLAGGCDQQLCLPRRRLRGGGGGLAPAAREVISNAALQGVRAVRRQTAVKAHQEKGVVAAVAQLHQQAA